MVLRAQHLLKPLVFVACLLPALWLGAALALDALGANPIEALTRSLGDWALRLLLAALLVTPLRQVLHWPGLVRLRRMLGLFAFAYVVLHLAAYVGLDQFFDWHAIGKDIVKRTYITLGMACFVVLVPLAATSTNAMIRRLGGARWRALHRLAYGAGVLGVAHYWLMVKADIRQPAVYALILALALAWRARGFPWRRPQA